jgi:hypothetical protein
MLYFTNLNGGVTCKKKEKRGKKLRISIKLNRPKSNIKSITTIPHDMQFFNTTYLKMHYTLYLLKKIFYLHFSNNGINKVLFKYKSFYFIYI